MSFYRAWLDAKLSGKLGKGRRQKHRRRRRQPLGFLWDTEVESGGPPAGKPLVINRLGWCLVACMVAGVVMLGVWVWQPNDGTGEQCRPEQRGASLRQPPADPKTKSDVVIAELLGFINDADHATRSLRIYELVDTIAHLRSYYDKRGRALPKKVVNPAVTAVDLKGREIILVVFQDEAGRTWSAPFEWDRGSYRLHWEAMTGFGEISWQEFFKNHPSGHYKMRATFFLPEEAIESPAAVGHAVVLMSHPDLEQPVSVLVPLASQTYLRLTSHPRATDIPALVEIHWPDASATQPVLSSWIHDNWIRSDDFTVGVGKDRP